MPNRWVSFVSNYTLVVSIAIGKRSCRGYTLGESTLTGSLGRSILRADSDMIPAKGCSIHTVTA